MYMYQSALWCDSCGGAIQKKLTKPTYRPWDSGIYPIYYPTYTCEADSPSHCEAGEDCLETIELPSGNKIPALLSYNLTEAGVEYLKGEIASGGE